MLEVIQDFKFKNLFMTGCSYVEYLEKEKQHRELKWWENLYIWYYENFEYIILVVGGILILLILYYHFWGDKQFEFNNIENEIQQGGNIDDEKNYTKEAQLKKELQDKIYADKIAASKQKEAYIKQYEEKLKTNTNFRNKDAKTQVMQQKKIDEVRREKLGVDSKGEENRMNKMNAKQKEAYIKQKRLSSEWKNMSGEDKKNISFMEKRKMQLASKKQFVSDIKNKMSDKKANLSKKARSIIGKDDASMISKRNAKLSDFKQTLEHDPNLTTEQKKAKIKQREIELKKKYKTTSDKQNQVRKNASAQDLIARAKTDPESAKELEIRKTRQQQKKEIVALKRSGASTEEIKSAKEAHAKQLMTQKSLPPGVPSNAPSGSTLGKNGNPVGPDGKPLKVGKDGKVLTGKKLAREEMRDKMKDKVGAMEQKVGAMKDDVGNKIMESRGSFYKIFFTIFITFALGIFIFPTIVLAGMGFLTFLITKDHITRLFTM